MRFKHLLVALCIAGFAGIATDAHAGALRVAGKEVAKGSQEVASATASGAGAAANGVASVATQTPGALKRGARAFGRGAEAAPGVAWHGTRKAARKTYKVIW